MEKLPIFAVVRCSRVCRKWKKFAQDEQFWKLMYKKYFGGPSEEAEAGQLRWKKLFLDSLKEVNAVESKIVPYMFRNPVLESLTFEKLRFSLNQVDLTTVYWAIGKEHEQFLRSLLGDLLGMMSTPEKPRKMIREAIRSEKLGTLELFFRHIPKELIRINEPLEDKRLLLELACCGADPRIVELLVKNGADVNGKR
jgi:hypothetical protein